MSEGGGNERPQRIDDIVAAAGRWRFGRAEFDAETSGLGELLQGRPAATLPELEDSAHVLRLTGLALAHHTVGDAAASDQDLQLLVARYGHILPYNAADVHAWRGEADEAFEWLERAYAAHDASFMYLEFDPLLRKLHGDPRFAALLARLHLPPLREPDRT